MRNQLPCRKCATEIDTKVNLRKTKNIGTWNIQGLIHHPEKLQIREQEMENYNLDILDYQKFTGEEMDKFEPLKVTWSTFQV